MAEVFLAERPTADGGTRQVAVKRMLRELARHTELVDLFVAEGLLLSRQLTPHAHLVRVFEVGSYDQRLFMEMEYVDGADLRKIMDLHAPGRVPPGAAIRIATDMARALDHVHHSRKVIHGDVSPANMLISRDGVAKLCDFGVAVAAHVGGNAVRGTTAYMSPEQVKGEARDSRSDVFALGAVVWELMAARPLFSRAAPHLTLVAIVEEPVPSCGDSEIDAVLARALAKDPAERMAAATELTSDLEALARARGLDTRRSAVAALSAARAAKAPAKV